MPVQQSHYETLLAEYSNAEAAIALLKQHRTYLEMIPSMRRPDESLITIPLPIVRLRDGVSYTGKSGLSITPGQAICLPSDLGIIMCDPEWKVKMGAEIFIFIHRPNEDFSDLLTRWRFTQVCLEQGYEWVMPEHYSHIYSQEAEKIYPLFVLFSETPERIKRGLKGANLPFVIPALDTTVDPLDYQSIDELEELDLEHHPEWKSWGEQEQ
ncbi:hypothetical protein [Limnoraphis robusta]|uniref:Uncharacterized protein n=1 Tax=Limnoraphis robusta CCNP1315 TaxID=3110306 RepID=A0ABU5U7N6_9CYAN|nr:hypothetical protein [Limnoraphis robusta]MEA5500970.1 hypothetical protein [Limnoraphis robusta BA-68 BA1]MEA5523222.1 hypothetical protein [Limnoraphis robusta CCNP1315]MEA5544777.1 hypothetical protein [Limnoraphis robusta CCNP1324]